MWILKKNYIFQIIWLNYFLNKYYNVFRKIKYMCMLCQLDEMWSVIEKKNCKGVKLA